MKKYILLPVVILEIGLLLVGQIKNSFAQEPPAVQNRKPASDGEVYQFVEEMAQFPGGSNSLYKWLSENIEYPDLPEDERITGNVKVKFVIDEEGQASDFQILGGGLSPAYNEAVLKAFRKFPKWSPAKNEGVPVKSYYILPVRFTTSN